MKLGRLLLLAGAALAANQFLKTEKGRQLRRDVTDKAGNLKEKLTEMVNRSGNSIGSREGGPGGASEPGNSGSPE